jgi:predicted TIM-barrel fold metal-dependent hydrolase
MRDSQRQPVSVAKRAMLITDSQIHLYPPTSPDRPLLPGSPGVQPRERHLPEDILPWMDEAAVQRAVLVPPSWLGYDNSTSLAWAADYPGRFAVMGRFDPFDPNRTHLEDWLAQPHMLGVRLAGALERGEWLDLDSVEWFWSTVERLGIPVMLLATGRRIALVQRVAERHPDLVIIMDHFGTTVGDLTKIDPWDHQHDVLRLARFPNVYGKLSALPMNTLEPFPFKSQTPYIRKAYDAFGPQRLAWGTDASRLRGVTYREAVDHMRYAVDFLTDEDRNWIMGKTISRVLKWGDD